MNDVPRRPERNELLIVGLGASAGGIAALKEFFKHTNDNSGAAYVVILHMSPEHESNLAQVLQTATEMQVSRVEDKSELKARCVYVISPNQSFTLADNHLIVSQIASTEERRAPVDVFFRTLAAAKGPSAVAVILSGTGADGSSGLKRIKEFGGCVFVQSPSEADFNDMPRNAIATGLVDQVLCVSDIPPKIEAYRDRLAAMAIEAPESEQQENADHALRDVLTLLRRQTRHDFTHYKRTTVLRRIERRMGIQEIEGLPDYARHIREHPDEVNALLRDLLISVTNFFRDREAFQALEEKVIPQLFEHRNADDLIRVWVTGCATGEEAYSIAMLLTEAAEAAASDSPTVQVFATDVDRDAIAFARDGLYTETACADIPAERLQRFFVKEPDGYRVRKDVREKVLFAVHDAIKNPPFSRLDLICCRNVLIYLNREGQQRVLNMLHFGLVPGGFLFAGSSESTDSVGDAFVAFDKDHRIYQSRALGPRPRLNMPMTRGSAQRGDRSFPERPEQRAQEQLSFADLHLKLLEQYAPPSVVINEDYDIVHMTERASRYLELPGGEPTHNLLKLIAPELRLELRTSLYQATQQRSFVHARGIKTGKGRAINLMIRPVFHDADPGRGFILVLFEETEMEEGQERVRLAEPIAGQLEEELTRVKTRLRADADQHELQNEELRASNEELQAVNEELHSATEEMETSREELQSLNEELTTVNQELKVKIEELSQANNDLHNLMNSTELGAIFLDAALRVKLFTPRAREVFNLIPADRGRALADITNKFETNEPIVDDVKNVLANLQPIDRVVRTHAGSWYAMRILPYRTSDNRIDGVVLTFSDVTERRSFEAELATSEGRLRLIVESAKDYAIFTTDNHRRVDSWNAGAQALFGYADNEIIGELGDVLFTPQDRERGAPEHEAQRAHDEGRAEDDRWHVRKDGTQFYGSGLVRPLHNPQGTLIGFVKIMRDLTERKRAEEELHARAKELERFNRAAVGRELRMIELKKEVNELLVRLGEPRRYTIDFADAPDERTSAR